MAGKPAPATTLPIRNGPDNPQGLPSFDFFDSRITQRAFSHSFTHSHKYTVSRVGVLGGSGGF